MSIETQWAEVEEDLFPWQRNVLSEPRYKPLWVIIGYHPLYTQLSSVIGMCCSIYQWVKPYEGQCMILPHCVRGFWHSPAGECVLLRFSFGFLDPFESYLVLLLHLKRQIMLWISSQRGVRIGRVLGWSQIVVPAGWGGSASGRWRNPADHWWCWRGRPWCGQPIPPAGFPATTCIPRWRTELWL